MPGPKPKGTELSLDARLAVVADLLTKCFTHGAIEKSLAAEWQITTRAVRGYISRVRAAWAANGVQASREERAFSRARNKAILEQLINDRMSKPAKDRQGADFFVVVRAVHELNMMDGHHATKRVEVTGANGGPVLATVTATAVAALADDELDLLDRLAEKVLLAKGKAPPAGEIIDEKPLPLPATGTR